MGATNHTDNYNLPQFIGTDKPTWLTDINGAFLAIDTAMKNNADEVAGAKSDILTDEGRLTALETSMGTANGKISTLEATATSQGNAITANTAKIGTAVLQTSAQNLSGAVNELNAGKLDAGQLIIKRMYTAIAKTINAGNSNTWTVTLTSDYTGYRPFLCMIDDTGDAGVFNSYCHFNSTTELELRFFNATGSNKSCTPKFHVYWVLESVLNNIS